MPSAAPGAPVIFVLAGVNGAGKSSLGGALIRSAGLDYFNPDEAARRIRDAIGCSADEASSRAWEEGKLRLEAAIRGRFSHAFESTLGGRTIPALLVGAARTGFEILVWFTGLSSPEQHIARVRSRVAAGGHDIPEEMIRQRWDRSRRNVIALMPYLTELKVFDNSEEGDPAAGLMPAPRLLLHWRSGAIIAPSVEELRETPEWAKAMAGGALKLIRSRA
ncbi:MAG TPA: ZTL protein [Thermoanaerobaculia bacterium]|nr:ZTL protein [Thermoanaerobaculia bacterium]